MAERGTEHEARIARTKLDKLETEVAFVGEPHEGQGDLFSALPVFSRSPNGQSRILSVEEKDSEIGSYVKWALLERLNLPSTWKKRPSGRSELIVPVPRSELPPLRELADHIQKSFATVLREYTAEGTVNNGKRAPFLGGLYDGMMGSGRDAGVRVPAAIGSPRKGKKRNRTGAEPVLEIHPYELGLALGAKIAMKISPKALKGEMQKLMAT